MGEISCRDIAALLTHRDLKPGNIMLDEDGRVKVLDFGLAKLVEEVSEEDLTASLEGRTEVGQVVGTLAYMSPEQAEGIAVDHRSDVFSLGILLYEMATGRNPFKRSNNVSTLSAIVASSPPPLGEVNLSLPPELGAIIARCLARNPDDRYPSAAELRQDLAELEAQFNVARSLLLPGLAGGLPRHRPPGSPHRRPGPPDGEVNRRIRKRPAG